MACHQFTHTLRYLMLKPSLYIHIHKTFFSSHAPYTEFWLRKVGNEVVMSAAYYWIGWYLQKLKVAEVSLTGTSSNWN